MVLLAGNQTRKTIFLCFGFYQVSSYTSTDKTLFSWITSVNMYGDTLDLQDMCIECNSICQLFYNVEVVGIHIIGYLYFDVQ